MSKSNRTDTLARFNNVWFDGLQFCAAVYALFEEMRAAPGGVSQLRLRKGAYKELIEELLPIACFLQHSYTAGRYIDVRWRVDEPFDAELRQRGGLIDHGMFPSECHLEVTNAMHPKDFMQRKLLEQDGSAFGVEGVEWAGKGKLKSTPYARSGDQFVRDFANLVVAEIRKKSVPTYPPRTALIVQCTTPTYFFPSEWDFMCELAIAGMPQHQFDQVFLCDLGGTRCTFLPVHQRRT